MKPAYILGIVIAVIAIVGVIYLATNNAPAQAVKVGDTINVSYTGTFTNGTVFDSNVGKTPLEFTVGSGQLIQGFDQAVVGMEVGQQKTITLLPTQAYGEVNSTLIVNVPANSLNQTPTVGMVVTRTAANGQAEEGMVTAVNRTGFVVDFNPPLAGKTLVFTIKILSIVKSGK